MTPSHSFLLIHSHSSLSPIRNALRSRWRPLDWIPYSGEGGRGWGSSPPGFGRDGLVPFSPSHSWRSGSRSPVIKSAARSPSPVVDGCSCCTGRGAGWCSAAPFSPGQLPLLDYSIRGPLTPSISPMFYGWTGRGGAV
jgi:hypothetical protein